MDDQDRKAIRDNLSVLSENCNFNNILEYLKIHGVFTSKQLRNYESESFKIKGDDVKCQQLFTDIQTRGPQAFFILLQCLKDVGQSAQYNILSAQVNGRVAENVTEVTLQVKKSRSWPTTEDVYQMKSYPKGYYIFINIIDFERQDKREGGHCDRDFVDILEDMGYRPFHDGYYLNQTKEQMWKLLQDFASDEALSSVDSCIVIVSTHGDVPEGSEDTVIYGTDDSNPSNFLRCNDIISLFNSDQCKLRAGCPKVFFINACRGDANIHNGMIVGNISRIKQSHRAWRDTFFLAPSMEGFRANRFVTYGSWLFMAAKEVFMNHAHNKDLESMKNLMNDQFDMYYTMSKYQQILSYYEYGVCKRLYFNPGLYNLPSIEGNN